MSLSQYSVARDKTSYGATVKSHALHMVSWAPGALEPMERDVRSHRFEEEVPVASIHIPQPLLINIISDSEETRFGSMGSPRQDISHGCLVGTPY